MFMYNYACNIMISCVHCPQLSLRDNPLVTRFVNSCARELMYNPPSLLELAARVIKLKRVEYTSRDLPRNLVGYLSNGQRCVNPQCKGERRKMLVVF